MKHIKLFESWMNEEFYIQGFKENMKSYVIGDISQYIDLDEEADLYYVNIPYDKVKNGIDGAHKIIAISQKYPKNKSAVLNGDEQEIRLVFTNESLSEAKKVKEVINVGDDVIENPNMEGFGFEGKIGKVKKKDDSKDFISYLVKFGSKEQEYHDNEIIKAPKKK